MIEMSATKHAMLQYKVLGHGDNALFMKSAFHMHLNCHHWVGHAVANPYMAR